MEASAHSTCWIGWGFLRTVAFPLAMCLAGTAGLAAQQAATINGAGLDTSERVILVTVLDGSDNRPISGVFVSAPDYGLSVRARTNRFRFSTDENGVAQVKLPPLHQQARNYSLSVQHSNYAERAVTWMRDSGSIRELLPSSYTIRLERGVTVGGHVRDARDQPVSGARVIPSGSAGANAPPGPGLRTWEYSSASPLNGIGSVTDKDGFWMVEHLPSDFVNVRLEVVRPGGARSAFATASERQYSGMPAAEVRMDALRSTNAVLKVEDGITVRGLVVDTNGKPVSGVRLKERSGRSYYAAPHVFTNQDDGRFELSHREAGQFILTAEVGGFASKSTIVSPAATAEVRIVLPPAQPMRLRVLGAGEAPVAGAELRVVEWRTPGQVIDWTGETDATGRVVWSNAPLEAVTFWITTTNYPVRAAKLKGGPAETIIRLRESKDQGVDVVIKAIEDPDGKPIGKFEVRKQFQAHEGYTDWGRSGDDGVFRTRLREGDFQNGFASSYRPMVVAEGYAPWTTDFIYADEGDQELIAKLRKTPVPAGVVLQPNGQPAAGARVHLNTSESSLFANRPGEFSAYRGVEVQTTATDGSFRFPTAMESHRLVVSHSSGFASLTIEELQRSNKVTLQPWGRVEGTLRVGGKPLAKERIAIRSPISWVALESHHLVFNANTDADGRFTFTNLPPGDYVIYRTPHLITGIQTTESHRFVFDVRPGEARKIDYGFGGRTVTGHVDADGTVDWQNDPHLLAVKQPPGPTEPSYYAFVDPQEFQKARKEFGRSPAVLEHERQRQQFQLVFDKNGDFRADDVPPGTYELRLRVTKPPANRNMGRYGREEELGSVTREVTIPPAAPGEEFDLGTFELPFKVPVAASGAPVSFKAVTLEGKPFDIASLRGRPAVLIFWAKWAPQSGAQLAEVRAACDGIGPEGRAAFVTVNLDESAEDARATMADLKRGWTHVRLEGPALFTVTEQFSIDTLPATLLLGADGRVNARDVGGKRLRAAIDRLVRQTAKN